MVCVLGRRIQTREHDSVEDARASMELFKRVRCEWKTDVEEPTKKAVKSDSVKRRRADDVCTDSAQSVKRPRLDSDGGRFLSDNYWPDDIQVCWF